MLAIGCDHGGFKLKEFIKTYLDEAEIGYRDFGCFSSESTDYPLIAQKVSLSIQKKECSRGLLFCGTGIGMSIAANKITGIRAAACSDYFSAKFTREHNDANILCLGERVVGPGLALELIKVFLSTEFDGGERHQNRINEIKNLEDQNN